MRGAGWRGGEKARRRSRRHGTRSGLYSERAGKGLNWDLTGRRFPLVYGAARGGPWLAHARARARHGARGARAREKRWAGPGRGLRRRGANAGAQFSGTRPLLELPTPGLPPVPGLGIAAGTREPALRSRACACAWASTAPGRAWFGRSARPCFLAGAQGTVSHCAVTRRPRLDTWTPVAWFVLLKHCLPGTGICRTNDAPAIFDLECEGQSQSPGTNSSIPKLWICQTKWCLCVYPGAALSSHVPELGCA